jgi:hypothetical protein
LEEVENFHFALENIRRRFSCLKLNCSGRKKKEKQKRVEIPPLPPKIKGMNSKPVRQRNARVITSCKQAHIGSLGLTNRRQNMENPKDDTPCNNGTFSNDFQIQYEKDQIVLKTLLYTKSVKIEKLEEILKSMGQSCPDRPQEAGRLQACCCSCITPSSQFCVFPYGDYAKDSGIYGPPPIQPVHNS